MTDPLKIITSHFESQTFPKPNRKVVLDESLLIGHGTKRLCYVDPEDKRRLIKVARTPSIWKKCHQQSLAEWHYTKLLKNSSLSPTTKLITYCIEWVDTNKGLGLVVERAVNNDNISTTLRSYLAMKKTSPETAKNKIQEFLLKAESANIAISDFNIDNFVVSGSDEAYSIIMVDGIGHRRPGVKLTAIMLFPLYARFRTRQQWKRQKKGVHTTIENVYHGDHDFRCAQPLAD